MIEVLDEIPGTPQLVCIGRDSTVLTELTGVNAADQMEFFYPQASLASQGETPAPGMPPPRRPFVALIDLEDFPLTELVTHFPWIREAEAFFLRTRLGAFWLGEQDFFRISQEIRTLGFEVTEVAGYPLFSPAQMPSGQLTFVCRRPVEGRNASKWSRYRCNEALVYLSAPVASRHNLRILASRSSFGFKAGIFNPGAVMAGEKTFLLARGERVLWSIRKNDRSRFFGSIEPVLLTLSDSGQIASFAPVPVRGRPVPGDNRIEDFRLFQFRGAIYSNHAVIDDPHPAAATTVPKLDRLRTRVGLSLLDAGQPALKWVGFPAIDRPLAQTEKNWAMFADNDRVFLIYTFSPYVLLSCTDWQTLRFGPFVTADSSVTASQDGLSFRNSINPIEYDGRHFFHIVHKVYPGKQYVFWGVLIDRQSLRPTAMTRRPLVRNWHSASATIVYVSGATADAGTIQLFAGLDDSSTASIEIPRAQLDAEWQPLPL